MYWGKSQQLVRHTSCYFISQILNTKNNKQKEEKENTITAHREYAFECECMCVCCVLCIYICMCFLDRKGNRAFASTAVVVVWTGDWLHFQ